MGASLQLDQERWSSCFGAVAWEGVPGGQTPLASQRARTCATRVAPAAPCAHSLVSAVMGDALAQYLSRPLGKAEWRWVRGGGSGGERGQRHPPRARVSPTCHTHTTQVRLGAHGPAGHLQRRVHGPAGAPLLQAAGRGAGGGGGVWGGEAWVLNGRPPIDLCVPSQFLQSVLPHAPKSLAAIASKLAIDQLIFAPVCTLIFYAYKVATELRAGCARARACSAAARRSCTRAPLCHPATPWRAESTCRS